MTRAALFDAIRPFAPERRFSSEAVAMIDALADKFGLERIAGATKSLKDAEAFYKGVRAVTGPLDDTQVSVIESLLHEAAHWPISWVAYGLATAWHEARLRPIEEIGRGKGKKYGNPGKHGGQIAYGRGLVQLTWDYNYETMDEALGLNGQLTRNYALALQPKVAVDILVLGMERGKFTGKSLATYLSLGRGAASEFKDARRIINGTDRDELIAGYALQFQAALTAGGWS